MIVTIGISTSTKKQGLFFTFIAYTKSKDEKKLLWQKSYESLDLANNIFFLKSTRKDLNLKNWHLKNIYFC
jgi:hypothetical protein